MKFKEEVFKVIPATHDEGGAKLEPEERPMERRLVADGLPISLNTSGPHLTQPPVARLQHDTVVTIEGTVGEFAHGLRHLCASCTYFDNELWMKRKREWETGDISLRKQLNVLRGMLLESQNATIQEMHRGADDDMDVEHALNSLGICRALSEIQQDDIIMHPLAGCPDFAHDAHGNSLYKPKNREMAQRSTEVYDAIMKAALGRRD